MGSEAGVTMAERLKIIINGTVLHASLEKSTLSEQLASLCPFESKLQRRGGHEYYSTLPKTISGNDSRKLSQTKKNQLTYFEGWNALSFLFEDADISPYSVDLLGEFEEDVASFLKGAGKTISVRCEVIQGEGQ